jgi:hypothetical protein
MADIRRDGALALGSFAVLAAVGAWRVGVTPFTRPVAITTGIVAALAAEWCFLAVPSLATGWERRGVPLASAVGFAALVGLLARVAPWIVGAAAWGLLTYGVLLGCVLVGLGNPLTRLPGATD